MHLGVQYYRAPFPDAEYWEKDMQRIREHRLDTIQFWVLWSWVESSQGTFCFDDYDKLMELAEKNGLKVVLSTVAELHPYWIHHAIPGSELITRRRHKVISSNRNEAHQGLTPGGCFDHPQVWEKMGGFLREVVTRYRGSGVLLGWDAWNELRWNVHAGDRVCYCEHTIAAFRDWLKDQYGDLDGLNKAWNRRYSDWNQVEPGIAPRRPYTETIAFDSFITWRAGNHGKKRYDLIKSLDPNHPVTLHAATPSPLMEGHGLSGDQPINRGNDWDFAESVDGIGTSSFPLWDGLDDAAFGLRVECVKSAAQDKAVWLSEIQGGRASSGFEIYDRVDPPSQQRWIWNGLACGAETFLFWCWRDEVFGYESAGFGLDGRDGWAEARLEAMKKTGGLLTQHADLLAAYQPAEAETAILFSPSNYYLHDAEEEVATRAASALQGYARALARIGQPYCFIEERHLDALDGIRFLILPRTLVTSPALEERLETFVRAGGTLLVESECGAFTPEGFYRYPEKRFTSRLCESEEVGRRALKDQTISPTGDAALPFAVTQWLTPWKRDGLKVLADHEDGALLAEKTVGEGKITLCASYPGEAYFNSWNEGFENLLSHLTREANFIPDVRVLSPKADASSFVHLKYGESQGKKVIFLFAPAATGPVEIAFAEGYLSNPTLRDIISDAEIPTQDGANTTRIARVPVGEWGIAVLVES